jgi:hypothetical protein
MDSFFSIVCLNATSGETMYKKWMGREIYGMAYSLKRLYTSYEQKATFVYDAYTGDKLSYYEIPSMSWSKPSLYNDKMYLGCHDWNVYCFGEKQVDTTYYGNSTMSLSSPSIDESPSASAIVSPVAIQAETIQSPSAELTQTQSSTVTPSTEVVTAIAVIAIVAVVALILKRRK